MIFHADYITPSGSRGGRHIDQSMPGTDTMPGRACWINYFFILYFIYE
jgi:hypothetical protein